MRFHAHSAENSIVESRSVSLLHVILGSAVVPGSIPVDSTMDSEDGFYAATYLAYGVAKLWCVQDLKRRSVQVQAFTCPVSLRIRQAWAHSHFPSISAACGDDLTNRATWSAQFLATCSSAKCTEAGHN